MHELSAAKQIIEAVLTEAAKNGIKRVDEVTVDYNRFEYPDIKFLSEHVNELKDHSILRLTNFHYNPVETEGVTIAEINGEG